MFTLKEKGKVIAVVKGGSRNGEILSITDDAGFEKFQIPMEDAGILELVPSMTWEKKVVKPYRDALLIIGPSGAGKSTLCAKYCKRFKKLFPDSPIFMFSRKTEDPAFEGIELNRVKMDMDLVTEPIDIQSEEVPPESLFVFDDYDTLADPAVQAAVTHLVMDILETGRAKKIYIVLTSHLLRKRNRNENDVVYNEIHRLAVPTKLGNLPMLKRTLENQFGLSGPQIKKILEIKSRWMIFGKEYPQYVLWEKGGLIL